MATGHVLPLKIPLKPTGDDSVSEASDERPQMVLELWGQAPPPNKAVRITVYDLGLLEHGPLAKQYKKILTVFSVYGPQIVPSELEDTKGLVTDGENGVLLVVDTSVLGTRPLGAKENLRWAFLAPDPKDGVARCVPLSKPLGTIALRLHDINNDDQLFGEVNVPPFALSAERTLVTVVEILDSHEILFSSRWNSAKYSKSKQFGTIGARNSR